MNLQRILPLALTGTVVLLVLGAIAYSVVAAASLPSGPVDLVWDKAACAHCSMHLGEPRFAAQLTTKAGRTLAFDDPGCLFRYLAEEHPQVHAAWFRHLHEARWLAFDAVAFLTVTPTPMGYGLGAVDPGTPGAIDAVTAAARCRDDRSKEDR